MHVSDKIRSRLVRLFVVLFSGFPLLSYTQEVTKLDGRQIGQYRALLHIQAGKITVDDPSFYISEDPTDTIKEIESTKKLILGDEKSYHKFKCRFPARTLWLAHYLDKIETPNFSDCPQLNTFIQQVPASRIELVYASENLMSPSSFMGHSFIKLSNQDGSIAHSVSFFTNVEGINVPKIMFDSLVLGKEGYFVVSPFEESLRYYLDVEDRNIYEYEINISDFEKSLLKLHLWELKDTKIDYFFHNQNCANITLNLIAIAQPKIMRYRNNWLSPLDVVQLSYEFDLIKSSQITPSLEWRLRTYGSNLTSLSSSEIKKMLLSGNLGFLFNGLAFEDQYVTWLYARSLNEYLQINSSIGESTFLSNESNLAKLENSFSHLSIDMSDFKNPVNRKPDSQFSVGYRTTFNSGALLLEWLPASHLINDDNRNAFSESSLELMHITTRIERESIKLEKLTIYAIESLLPYEIISGGFSGKFGMQWKDGSEQLSQLSNPRFEVFGGGGLSFSPNANAITYGLTSLYIASNSERAWLIPQFELGAMAYFKNDIKLSTEFELTQNEFIDDKFKYGVSASVSYFGLYDGALSLHFTHTKKENVTEKSLMLNYQYYY